jgi:hypothetical protein
MAVSIRRQSLLAVAIVLGAVPAWAQNGTITGTVRDAVTRAPVSTNIVLCVEVGAWCRAGWATDAAGVYRAGEISPGTYYVYTFGEGGAYADEIFPDILCPGECSFETALQSGAPLVVTAGSTLRADFDLDRGGVITGTVSDATTAAPIGGVAVVAHLLIEGEPWPAGSGFTDATGRYEIAGLPAGRYYVHTSDPSMAYVNEVFDNRACGRSCTGTELVNGVPIAVALGATSGGRDFALDRGGRITGTITDSVTALPLYPVCVKAFVALSGGLLDVAQACSDATGEYAIDGLPAGSYYLRAVPPFGSAHVQELYDGMACPAAACDLATGTPVAVALGATASGRDFTLETGGAIRGIVREAATGQAAISGDVVVFTRSGPLLRTAGRATVDYQTGEYLVSGLPAGTYYAHTYLSGYRDEIFDDVRCQAQRCSEQELTTLGTPLGVAGGATTTGVDFAVANDLTPGVPQPLSAIVNGSTVTLSWGPPEQGGAPAGYLLEAGASPGATFVQHRTADLRLVVMGVAAGRYFVRVRAENGLGAGPASDDVLVVIAGSGAPPASAPVDLVGWMSGPRLTLTWGAAPFAAGVSGYVVQAGSATGLSDVACVGVNARALTFVPVATGYYFLRVRAMNSHGLGPASNEVLINAGYVPSPPEPPRHLLARVDGATVVLEWSAPSGGAPEGYVIRAGSAPGRSDLAEAATGPADTMRTFSGVPPGVYYVRVHAVGALGLGPSSNEVTVVVR